MSQTLKESLIILFSMMKIEVDRDSTSIAITVVAFLINVSLILPIVTMLTVSSVSSSVLFSSYCV